MFLRFVRRGAKWAAETPGGELLYGDDQGLYEWTLDPRGVPVLLQHAGGDRQVSRGGRLWSMPGASRDSVQRGLVAAAQNTWRGN